MYNLKKQRNKPTDTENRWWLPEVRTRESMKSVRGKKVQISSYKISHGDVIYS